jgi:quercetin dioxygenase-like cupin family protein
MSAKEFELIAGEYVLGTLAAADRDAFARRLAYDPEAREAVARWQQRLAPLAGVGEPGPAPTALWHRIAQRSFAVDKALPGARTVVAASGEWVALAPGVDKRELHVDHVHGFRAMFVRMAPGSVLPAHDHPEDEECLMLEGEIVIGDLVLGAGDWHLAPKGRPHAEIRSPKGGLLYVRAALDEHA